VIHFELSALERLLGQEEAKAVGEFWAKDHYRALYRAVLDSRTEVNAIARKHNLLPFGI
jgi:hypothetical protein